MNYTRIPVQAFALVMLAVGNLKAQYHYTKEKPDIQLTEENRFIDNRCIKCYKLDRHSNYDSVLYGVWYKPHEMFSSIQFNADGTFCMGGEEEPCGVETLNRGTYTFSGANGWLTFGDGSRREFHLVLEKLNNVSYHPNPQNLNETSDYRYILFVQYKGLDWYYIP